MRGQAHCHCQGLRVGEAQWEGQGGWAERETGNEQPTSKGNTASGPSGRGCPPQPHTPAVGAVLRGAHLSHSPLGVLLLTAHVFPTHQPCMCLDPSTTHPTRELGHSTGHILLSCHFTDALTAFPGTTDHNVSEPKSGKALRRAGIVNATSIL